MVTFLLYICMIFDFGSVEYFKVWHLTDLMILSSKAVEFDCFMFHQTEGLFGC